MYIRSMYLHHPVYMHRSIQKSGKLVKPQAEKSLDTHVFCLVFNI